MDLTINNLCRVCLKNSYFHSNIYKDRSTEEIPVYELVNDLCALGIRVDDGLPVFLCCECFIKVQEFKTFKTNAHKGLSVLLLLKDKFQNPVVKQEELDISGDEYEESFVGTNTEQGFGPIILKQEMLTVFQNNLQQEEFTESEEFENVGVIGLSAMSMEDSPQIKLTSLETFTHPKYRQCLDYNRTICTPKEEIDSDSCAWSISSNNKSKNYSLCEDVVASSSGTMERLDRQRILQGESINKVPLIQQNTSIGKEVKKESERMEENIREADGLRRTITEKGVKDRREGLECFHCGIVLISKRSLIQHMKVHGFDNTYDCAICGKVFPSNYNLKRHVLTHTGSKPYKCMACSKSFTQNYDLKMHMRLHSGSNPYKCNECSKCFSQCNNLKVHMRTHTGYKPYKCAVCSKSFYRNTELKIHMRKHTGSKPYKCAECSKCFRENADLKIHMRKHTTAKPYRCSECTKCFSRYDELQKHMRIHTGSKPYKCTECCKCFSQNSNLKRHTRIHCGSKPYKCTECSKSFSQNSELKIHMRSHTG